MKTMLFALFAAAFAVPVSLAGNTCTWTGGANDGKWSSAANWDTPPVSGNDDALIFAGGAVTSENDIDDMSIGGISCSGTGTKTFNGKTIILNAMPFTGYNANNGTLSRTYTLSNACTIVYNAKLDFSNTGRILLDPGVGSATFNGDIFVRKGKTLYIGDAFVSTRDTRPARPFYFNGRIDAPEGTIVLSQWGQSTLYMNGAVDVLNFNFDYPASAMYLPDFAGGVKIRSGQLHPWYGPLHFRCGDVFGEDLPVMDIGGSYWSSGEKGTVYLDGHTVVIDRLGPGARAAKYPDDTTGNSFSSSTPATLWMKATGNTSTSNIVRGAVSIVWDPSTSAATIEFKGRRSNTSGSIEVKRGTFRISDTATFTNVPSIKLGNGAVFEMAGTSTTLRPLNKLTSLEMASGSRFVVMTGATIPFADDGTLKIAADPTARLALPAGFSQKVKCVIFHGVPLAVGKYTGTGGAEGTPIDFIEGTGVLEVMGEEGISYWSGDAGDGDWTTAGNWIGGVPGAGDTAMILKDAVYSITGPSAIDAKHVEMNPLDGHATLDVPGALTISGTTFDVATNSTFALGVNADVEWTTPTDAADTDPVFTVRDGGEAVFSGRFVTSNLYGRILVKDGASLRFDNAQFHAAPPANKSYGRVIRAVGSTVAITNSNIVLGYNFNNSSDLANVPTLSIGGGSTTTIHDTYLRLDQWVWGTIFGTGEATLSGNTHLSMHYYIRGVFGAENEGEESLLRVTDSAIIDGPQELAVGAGVQNTRSRLVIDSQNAMVTSGSGFQVGCENGYGEVEVRAGLLQGGGSYGMHIGYKKPQSNNGADGQFPTGVVKVCGGAFQVRGNVGTSSPMGLVVGDGNPLSGANYTASRYTGILELSSGSVTNDRGHAIFGFAHAFGRMAQSGGNFVSTISLPAVIGMAGGEGEWLQSGGSATFRRNVYVGGAITNVLNVGTWKHAAIMSRHDAQGLLAVTGGTFAVDGNYDIVVASDGEGVISVSGDGAISARDVILSNTVDTASGVTRVATLKVVVDADGKVGSIAARGRFVIRDGAKFVCDLSGYSGKKTLFRLVSAQSVEGSFAPQNIEFTGPYAKFAELRQSGSTIEVALNRGTMILLK